MIKRALFYQLSMLVFLSSPIVSAETISLSDGWTTQSNFSPNEWHEDTAYFRSADGDAFRLNRRIDIDEPGQLTVDLNLRQGGYSRNCSSSLSVNDEVIDGATALVNAGDSVYVNVSCAEQTDEEGSLFTSWIIAGGTYELKPLACSLNDERAFEGRDGLTLLLASTSEDSPSIYYRRELDINTDGAIRSYHPDDPHGQDLAFNNVANAIRRAWNADGDRVTCDNGSASNRRGACYMEFIRAFEGARNHDFDPTAFPRVDMSGIIAYANDPGSGHEAPCTTSGGYFVSQTSLILDPSAGTCSPSRYVDALTINGVVYPPNQLFSQGVVSDGGDLVVVRDRQTGRVSFAIHADTNAVRIGEGTVALAAELSEKTISGDDAVSDLIALRRTDVEYLVFPTEDALRHWRNSGPITQARINDFGAEVFANWGGTYRLDACAMEYERATNGP